MIFILNVLATILVVVFLGIVIIAIALIKASKKATQSHDNDVVEQLKQAITKARRIRLKAEADISRIRIMAGETITTALGGQIPANISADQLLDDFASVRDKVFVDISPEIQEKTEQLISGYKAQIELKKQEISMAQAVEKKYSQLLEQVKQAAQKQKINQRLDKQQAKLAQMQDSTDSQKQLIEQTYSYDMIAQDVSQKVEYLKALEELQQKYNSPELITDTQQYQKDLQQITEQLLA